MKDGKFHPITEHKGVRKSRDQEVKTEGVKIRNAREMTPFQSDINSLNTRLPFEVEYGTDGSNSKGLVMKGTHSFIAGKMTKAEASKCIDFTKKILDNMSDGRKKRDEKLQPFVKDRIAQNIAEIDLLVRDLEEEKREKLARGDHAIGELKVDIRLYNGALSSIHSLLEQVPEPLHKEIVEKSMKLEEEMKS